MARKEMYLKQRVTLANWLIANVSSFPGGVSVQKIADAFNTDPNVQQNADGKWVEITQSHIRYQLDELELQLPAKDVPADILAAKQIESLTTEVATLRDEVRAAHFAITELYKSIDRLLASDNAIASDLVKSLGANSIEASDVVKSILSEATQHAKDSIHTGVAGVTSGLAAAIGATHAAIGARTVHPKFINK